MKKKLCMIISCLFMLSGLSFFDGFRFSSASAENWTPNKPIAFIVPSAAGGGYDTRSRGLAQYLSQYTGTPVVIKNVPGAGNLKGVIALNRSKPDGYTIGMIPLMGIAIDQVMKPKFAVDLRKYTYLGLMLSEGYIFTVGKNTPYKSVEDMKNAKTPIKIGASGKTATNYKVFCLALTEMGVPFTPITGFQGSGHVVTAVMRGDLDAACYGVTSILSYVESGDLRPIWQTGDSRSQHYPNTPTVKELGYDELSDLAGSHEAIAAPPGLPKAQAYFLRDALWKAMTSPEFNAWQEKVKQQREIKDYKTAERDASNLLDKFNQEKFLTVLKKYLLIQ